LIYLGHKTIFYKCRFLFFDPNMFVRFATVDLACMLLRLACILLLLIKLYVKDVYIASSLIFLGLVMTCLVVLIDSISLLLINYRFEKLAASR
jgi:hypothetical protein